MRYLRCICCAGRLDVRVLLEDSEIDEGFLFCPKCDLQFPIVGKIAILRNFENYLAVRPRLGGALALAAKTTSMKSFVKKTLSKIKKNPRDVSIIEKRWSEIYTKNKRSKFYSKVASLIGSLDSSGVAVEHGCSVGIAAQNMAKNHSYVFGVDKSYYALSVAKKSGVQNLDYFVADSMEHPFGNMRFDLVVGLNMFELIEPKPLLKTLSRQVTPGGFLMLSDPYDYQRGDNSVREPLYGDSLRAEIRKSGFEIITNTRKPSFVPWNLRLYDRAVLQYRVDLIAAKKGS